MYVLDQPDSPWGRPVCGDAKDACCPFSGWRVNSHLPSSLWIIRRKASVARRRCLLDALWQRRPSKPLAYTLMMVAREDDELTIETKGRGAGDHTFLFTCTQDEHTEIITWTFGGADQGMLSGSRQKVVLQAFANARRTGTRNLDRGMSSIMRNSNTAPTPITISGKPCLNCGAKRVLKQTQSGLFTVVDASILPDPTPPDDDPGVTI